MPFQKGYSKVWFLLKTDKRLDKLNTLKKTLLFLVL